MWRRFERGESDLSWSIWGAAIERTPVLTAHGREIGRWALQGLSDFFGDLWIGSCLREAGQSVFMTLGWWPPVNAGILRRLFQLAAQLRLLSHSAGFSALRDRARGSVREPRFAEHLLVQLEVAALVLRSNEEITFELDLPTGRSVDLAVGGTDPLAIEVSVQGSEREVRQYDERYQRFVARILALLSRHNVGIVGDSGELDDEPGVQLWLNEIDQAAATTSRDGQPRRMAGPSGGIVELRADGSLMLEGSPLSGDQMAGLTIRIQQKAKQTTGMPSWLRIDEIGGLWYLTPWSREPLAVKLTQLTGPVREALEPWPHVAGLALSSRLRSGIGVLDETARTGEGALALRRNLRDGMCREIFIITNGRADRVWDVERPAAWYEGEVDWLEWALVELGKPPVEQLIRPTTSTTRSTGPGREQQETG